MSCRAASKTCVTSPACHRQGWLSPAARKRRARLFALLDWKAPRPCLRRLLCLRCFVPVVKNRCMGSAALPADLPDAMKRMGQLTHAFGREGKQTFRALRLLLSVSKNLRRHRVILPLDIASTPGSGRRRLSCVPSNSVSLAKLFPNFGGVSSCALKANRNTTQGLPRRSKTQTGSFNT